MLEQRGVIFPAKGYTSTAHTISTIQSYGKTPPPLSINLYTRVLYNTSTHHGHRSPKSQNTNNAMEFQRPLLLLSRHRTSLFGLAMCNALGTLAES
ncbi:unnamed protein product [Tuber melanosporum]|uniref:(Perigord truffle) hypothetical protein n=1 Tax=Tuber melanosporum (strain Mel28) TaxID=656061 RepID=D5GPC0_TUBMM|nr:uncharacterized protein GSTUM_00011794001 [Tuber melanosporum]CAZ86385.1 unnamed protein product [Tuber melanosporum]